MPEIESRVRELLNRNIILEKRVKDDILASDISMQADILPLLEKMDEHQTRMFGKVLGKKPHFFEELEAAAHIEALKKRFGLQQAKPQKKEKPETQPNNTNPSPYKVIINTYKRYNHIPKSCPVSDQEWQAFLKLYKSWVCSISSDHRAYRLLERQMTDYRRLGILCSDGTWSYRNLRRAVRFILKRSEEQPSFHRLKSHLKNCEADKEG